MKYILTNDPSITAWGFALINEYGVIRQTGCIKTSSESKTRRIRKGDDRIRRIQEINLSLLELIAKHDIRLILAEQPHGSQNANAAVMIGIVTGILQTISDCKNIPIEFYSEGDVKNYLLKKRSAVKDEMIVKVRQAGYDCFTGIKYRDEAVADAIGVYLLAKQQSPSLKMMLNENQK